MRAIRQSYDLVAERYAAEIASELQAKPLDRALLSGFAELVEAAGTGGPVLDIGCGPGHVAGYLRQAGLAVIGLDLSPAMCALGGQPAAAADMTELPVRTASVAGLICLYAVIHLDQAQRAAAYREFGRVLVPGGTALIAFHTSDAEAATGTAKTRTEWWGHPVQLTFRFLDPAAETAALAAAGLGLVARLDRQPGADEHPSQRSYLLVRNR